jgi:hypothetical protein
VPDHGEQQIETPEDPPPPVSPPGEPGDVRRHADSRDVAIKTDLGAGREWFVMTLANGGHYTDGIREGLDEWPELTDAQ